jgi:GST-like protein
MYIAEKEGKFWPQDLRGKYAVTEWLIWQMANQGQSSANAGISAARAPKRAI